MTLFPKLEPRGRAGLFLRALALKEYVVAVVLCTLILTLSLKLWQRDFGLPFSYWGDALMVQIWSKTIYEFGWYMENARLGAPYTMNLGDFPMADGLHQVIYKALGWITPNYAVALNVFYFLTFPLTTLTAYYASKKLGLSALPALATSLLYTYLPYHFLRNLHHVYLASYYVVPLSILVILRIYSGEVGVFRRRSDSEAQEAQGNKRGLFGSLVICILQGCAGVYYGFFACYLLLIAGGASAIQRRRLSPILTALLFVAVTTSSLLVNLSPHILYRMEHGKNPEVATRKKLESEAHGLKIAQLILPSPLHRISTLAAVTNDYNKHAVSTGENYSSTLGAVGVLGFLFLLVLLCFPDHRTNVMLQGLSRLNIFCVLLATIGGFSSLFCLLVSPLIRGYNRISVFIAFFSLLAVGLILERVRRFLMDRGYSPWVFRGLVSCVILVGILDQIPAHIEAVYWASPRMEARWRNDAEFFSKVEESLPAHAMVFQYPHMNFPECEWDPAVPQLDASGEFRHTSYDMGRGYLHTKTLRWSLPIRGRYVDNIFRKMSEQPVPEQLRTLALGGFSGILVYRPGYADRAVELEAELTGLLDTPPLISPDQTMAFFDMRGYVERLEQSTPTGDWQREKDLAWNSPLLLWRDGFHNSESAAGHEWRWCGPHGLLTIHNPLDTDRQVHLEFTLATGHPDPSTVAVHSPLFSTKLMTNHEGAAVSETLTIPPGVHEIWFTTDAKPIQPPNDPRQLNLQVRDFRSSVVLEESPKRVATRDSK